MITITPIYKLRIFFLEKFKSFLNLITKVLKRLECNHLVIFSVILLDKNVQFSLEIRNEKKICQVF